MERSDLTIQVMMPKGSRQSVHIQKSLFNLISPITGIAVLKNTSLRELSGKTVNAFAQVLNALQLICPWYITQNDGIYLTHQTGCFLRNGKIIDLEWQLRIGFAVGQIEVTVPEVIVLLYADTGLPVTTEVPG